MATHSKRKVVSESGSIMFTKHEDDAKVFYEGEFEGYIVSIHRLYTWDPKPPTKKQSGFATYTRPIGSPVLRVAPMFSKDLRSATESGIQRVRFHNTQIVTPTIQVEEPVVVPNTPRSRTRRSREVVPSVTDSNGQLIGHVASIDSSGYTIDSSGSTWEF